MNNERKELLLYAVAVLVLTTLLAVCFPLFHITNNWVQNAPGFMPGLVAAAFLLEQRQGFRSIGWGIRPPIYLLWAVLLPTILIVMTLPLSVRLGYAAMAPVCSAAGGVPAFLLKILKMWASTHLSQFHWHSEKNWVGEAMLKGNWFVSSALQPGCFCSASSGVFGTRQFITSLVHLRSTPSWGHSS